VALVVRAVDVVAIVVAVGLQMLFLKTTQIHDLRSLSLPSRQLFSIFSEISSVPGKRLRGSYQHVTAIREARAEVKIV
jgi:hypothetical protein